MRKRAVLAFAVTCGLAACTETVVPTGVQPIPIGQTTKAMQVDFNEAAEAQLLTDACVKAERQGVNALAGLTQQGYIFVTDLGSATYLKQAPKTRTFEFIRSIGVTKKNNNLPCTIRVRPYTHGGAVLAVAEAELLRQGYTKTYVSNAFGGKTPRFTKGAEHLSVRGWEPGGTVKYSSGAEVIIARVKE